MYETIGELIPLAAGIAMSPIPIIAAILMLLSPHPVATSSGFLFGWLIGVALPVVAFVLLAELIPQADPETSPPVIGSAKILLGVGLLFLAARQWRSRPSDGDDVSLPGWMEQINEMSGVQAFRFGFMLAALNPKNLLLSGSAGITIAESAATPLIPTTIFVVVASLSVILPVVATLIAPRAMAAPLEGIRAWLLTNNATIMTVLLFVIGVVVVSGGIGSF